MSTGILLDKNDDLQINVQKSGDMITGGLTIGSRKMQDAYIVLNLTQGELKEDPICGANLVVMLRSRENKEKILKTIEISLERVGIRLDEIKDQFQTVINRSI